MPRDMAGGASHRTLGRAFLGLAVVTYGLLVFGASVRVHGAGLACPDWPLCFGEVVPQLDFLIFLEWGHRALASVVSFGFLTLGIFALRNPDARRRVGGVLLVAAVTLAAQIVLGGLTVLHLLAYWSVTLHLLFGNFFCALLLLIGVRLLDAAPARAPIAGAARGIVWALAVMVFVQMALGGLVSSNYAGLACTEWPTCNGGVWFPAFDGIVGMQIFHRLGAYTLAALAVAFVVVTRDTPDLRRPAWLLAGLVACQVALGVANVLLAMPVEIAILHSAFADLIVLSTAWAVARTTAHAVRAPAPKAVVFGATPEHA